MTQREQTRLQVLNSLMADNMTTEQAATLMGVSARHTRLCRMLPYDVSGSEVSLSGIIR